MSNTISTILFIIMAIVGGSTSLCMIIGIPGILLWKLYRVIRYGYKFTD